MKKTMLDYINSIPELVTDNLLDESLTKEFINFYKKSDGDLILVASGSSFNACMSVKYALRDLLDKNVEVFTAHTFKYYEMNKYKDKFILVVSQGGKSTNCIDLVDNLKANGIKGAVLTSDVESEIGKHLDEVFDYGIGIETVGYVTRGYVGLIVFLLNFAINYGNKSLSEEFITSLKKDMESAHDIFENIVNRSTDLYQRDKKNMLSTKIVHIVSSGDCLGLAREAALKISETTKIPAMYFEVEEFLHGPNLQLTPDYTIAIIDNLDDTSAREYELFKALKQVTDKCYFITDRQITDENVIVISYESKLTRLIYSIVPFQLFSYYVTEIMGTWKTHPLMEKFDDSIVSKAK
ncbi:SIS domain-containing protein [Anaerococcus marasmi]|uniref:SIS domain-containing protein n=1 Tax=Anaerococcus marasmi TaxID=2057797 RepID=UPI00131A3EB5|nr:SIS domain-containing protein [Anaerococcus marasmi]